MGDLKSNLIPKVDEPLSLALYRERMSGNNAESYWKQSINTDDVKELYRCAYIEN